jgi:protein-disulfide isomerase
VDALAPAPAPRPTAPRPHPQARLALATAALAVLTGVCLSQVVFLTRAWASAETIKAIGKVMYEICPDEPANLIAARPDDPQMTAGDGQFHLQTVVFTDFTCPLCQQLSETLKEEINPLFGGHLQIIAKHYPLCSECNANISIRSEDRPCRAARAAEAARMQGGSQAFWAAHDLLFQKARQGLTAEMDYRELAQELQLDPDRFARDAESEEVARRIREDVSLGRSLGVSRTPAVFVSGRRIPPIVVGKRAFWEAAAQVYEARAARK